MERTEKVLEKLKKRGMKITPQRVMILKYLEGNKNHPTPEEIYRAVSKKLSAVSYATVYNVLELLKELGEVKELVVGRRVVRYDPITEPHHHAVCKVCGKVFDVDVDLSSALKGLEKDLPGGFKPESVEVFIRGVCKSCQDKGK